MTPTPPWPQGNHIAANHDFVPVSPQFVSRIRKVARLIGVLSVLLVAAVMIGIAVSCFMLLALMPAAAIFSVVLGWLAGAFAVSSALALATSASCVNTGAFNLNFARRSRRTLLFLAVSSILPTGIAVLILAAGGGSAGEFPPAAAVCLVLLLFPFAISVIDMVVGRHLLDLNRVGAGPYGAPQR